MVHELRSITTYKRRVVGNHSAGSLINIDGTLSKQLPEVKSGRTNVYLILVCSLMLLECAIRLLLLAMRAIPY